MSGEVFEGEIVIGTIANVGAPAEIGVLTLQFVRYPGSQQLTLWLPQSGYFGYGELRVFAGDKHIERAPVRDRLNGSVQILFDTLTWAPGLYHIEIDHDGGWRHEARLEKLAENVKPPAPPSPPPAPTEDRPPIVYRDGFGKIIPDVDLEIRAKAREDLAKRFAGPHLEFDGNYRAGTITYVDGERRIDFSHEMAGGRYKFYIDIPSPAQWEAATKTPLSERDRIVHFVAEETQRRQARSWKFEIEDTQILFY